MAMLIRQIADMYSFVDKTRLQRRKLSCHDAVIDSFRMCSIRGFALRVPVDDFRDCLHGGGARPAGFIIQRQGSHRLGGLTGMVDG
jgi:hypothetical protein